MNKSFFLAGLGSLLISCEKKEEAPDVYVEPVFTEESNGAKETMLSVVEMKQAVDQAEDLILDVRPRMFYDIGHIPTAISFPNEAFNSAFKEKQASLDKAIKEERRIILYCSGSYCSDSTEMAEKLVTNGYDKLLIFKGGWEEWNSTGFPVESNY